MKFPLSGRLGTAAVVAAAAVLLLASSLSFAGRLSFGVKVGDKVDLQPDATAHFGCEKRPFNLSKGLYCYGPAAIRAAYAVNGLLNNGFDGKGRTIVILDAFGSPFVTNDLKLFDKVFGLPDPPSFTIITMPGTPPYDPNDPNIVGWTAEIALDVEWSHAMAPGANIVLVAAKSNSDQDLIDGLNYAIDHHLGDVVSMSFGESEADLANPDGLDIVAAWQNAFAKAKEQHITLFVSSGDQGSTNEGFPFQNVGWPASSDLVTSVGGTNLKFGTATNADPNGTYQSEMVWNDGFGAGGGGMSFLVDTPDFQQDLPDSVKRTLHGNRGVPDVAYNAGVVGGVVVAWAAPFGPGSFFIFGGTSAGAPQWAGIVADINQAKGRPLGFLNKQLYKLGNSGSRGNFFHDITTGNNAFGGVPGYAATPGYDLATGWGTPKFGTLGLLLADGEED